MNNTFCLGIFLALIYMRGMKWTFSAETISIVVVQLIIVAVSQAPHLLPSLSYHAHRAC